jgi:hypothetical protein
MNTKVKKLDQSFLLKIGMKQALLDKLNKVQIEGLLSFAMDHMKAPNLSLMVVQLASMELNKKSGSIMLAANGLATPIQLKNLTHEQVKMIHDDYTFHEDSKIAVKTIKKMLVFNQQEKLYTHTDGIKGEFFIDPKDAEDEDYA